MTPNLLGSPLASVMPPAAVAALASFVRARLAEMSGTVSAVSTVVVGAAAPFAPTSYSRARLVRQMHASGLLNGERRLPAATCAGGPSQPSAPALEPPRLDGDVPFARRGDRPATRVSVDFRGSQR